MNHLKARGQHNIKQHNCKMVLNLIKAHPEMQMSRAEIAKLTGMSPTSITRIVTLLEQQGFLEEAELFSAGLGRKATRLNVAANKFLTLGISLDSDFVKVCILDFKSKIVVEKTHSLDLKVHQADEIISLAFELYQSLCQEGKFDPANVSVIGISCIGNIDHKNGNALFVPQFRWIDAPLAEIAKQKFNLPVYIDNDTKMALLGETKRLKEMRDADVCYISIGTGVGSAIMYNGHLVRGINNAAGEVGHTTFELEGRLCDCGRRGCVQTYLTINAVVDICKERGHAIESFSDIMKAWNKKEEWALKTIEKLTNHIAILISNMAYTYNPQYILVAGLLIMDYPELFELSATKVGSLMHENLFKEIRIRKTQYGSSSLLGASLMAQDYYIDYILSEDEAFVEAYWKAQT